MKLFMNGTTFAGVILAIVGVVFGGVVYLVNPEGAAFIMDIERQIIIPAVTVLILGGPIRQIAHNTNGALTDQLNSQTREIISFVRTDSILKDGEQSGK